jgi:SAM-dependent methyltransferase
MKPLDRFLQHWRIHKTRPYITRGARVLDIGCADGELFRVLTPIIGEGVGIDPDLERPLTTPMYRLIRGWFPQALPDSEPFDTITLLAVLEHIPLGQQAEFARDCVRALTPNGRLIITVPSPLVDHILAILLRLRLVDGMAVEQHYGFKPDRVPALFGQEMRLVTARTFQFGLNHLFVFQKCSSEMSARRGRKTIG